MVLKYADRVQETTTTTGTGTYSLAGAVLGFQTFVAGVGDTNTCWYMVTDGTDWEVGLGTVTDAGTDTLARTLIIASSNAGAAVNWSAGTKQVICTIPAIQAGVPPGTIIENAGSVTPFGYLLCDGSPVSRTTYAQLFTAIGTTWGVGDGSTTFNVPDRRGRVGVGAGTGAITETQAAANFNTSDVITVNSNPVGKAKWVTGMVVQVTTSGVLPTGISAVTNYFVRRLSATTISLYATLANALDTTATTGRVDITATGSGNHTLTCTLSTQALADLFGVEFVGDVPSHRHTLTNVADSGSSGAQATGGSKAATATIAATNLVGQTEGVANMPPAIVMNYFIKY